MTVSRDLKALIHERMQKTGESYVPARRNVLAQRHTPSLQIVESTDETDSIRATPAWDPVVVRRFRTPEEAKAARPAISTRNSVEQTPSRSATMALRRYGRSFP